MAPVENAIDRDLIDGRPAEAVDLFLQLVDSLCYHFVADEHWCWFDDCYDPGYMADGCWKRIKECLGWFPEEVVERLKEGFGELCKTEAYRGYGYPSVGEWQWQEQLFSCPLLNLSFHFLSKQLHTSIIIAIFA